MASLRMPFWPINLYRGACIFSERWCEVQAVIEATLGIASILTMGLIAFDRYIRVVKQALYNRLFPSKRTARLYRGVVWIASTFFATPPLYGWGKVVYHRRYAICNFAWKIEHMSYVLVIVGSVGTTQPQLQFFTATTKFIRFSKSLNVHGTDDAVASSRLPRPDIRVLKTSFIVVCVFLMTWGQLNVLVIWSPLRMWSPERFVPHLFSSCSKVV